MDPDDLKNILSENCFPEIQSELMEKGNDGTIIQQVKINSDGVGTFLVLRIDPNHKDPFPYFKDGDPYHLKCICDYIILVEKGVKEYVLLVEMKSGSGGALLQLENSEAFWKFLQYTAQRKGIDVSKIDRTIKVKLHKPKKVGTKMEMPRYEKNTNCIIYQWSDLRLSHVLKLALQN